MNNAWNRHISICITLWRPGLAVAAGLVLFFFILSWLEGAGPAQADPSALYVHTALGADGPACGSSAAPCQTISYTVHSRAVSGDSLLLAAGVYSENLAISSLDLSIHGGYLISDSLWVSSTHPTVIDGNNLDRALVLHSGTYLLEDLSITGGQTPAGQCWGGGVWISNARATLRRVRLEGNQAGCSGAGLEVNNDLGPAALVLEDSILQGNSSGDKGGGLTVWHAEAVLTNVLVISNTAADTGSALYSEDSPTVIMNSTIAGNQGGAAIRAIETGGASQHLTVTNSILWDNQDAGLECDPDVCTARYSTIQGGWVDVGNLDLDPRFASPGDYHLQLGSPPVGRGASTGAPPRDLDAVLRRDPPDMGAYEWTNAVWPYPGHDPVNTFASSRDRWMLLDQPVELWNVVDPASYALASLLPVAADLDGDLRAEYVVGRYPYPPNTASWIKVFNTEDGSLSWEKSLPGTLYWSTPVIADLDRDGQFDVVFATGKSSGPNYAMALRGNDGSTLWSVQIPTVGLGLTVGDVHGDGWPEVVLNDYASPNKIHLLNGQTGDQMWERVTGGSSYALPAVADADGDGQPEIFSHSHRYGPSRENMMVWDASGTLLWQYLSTPSAAQTALAPPELGWTPDYGYGPATVLDFDGDGQDEIGMATRCHYYVIDAEGHLEWRTPTNVQGYGIYVTHNANGSINVDSHGTGGYMGWAAPVGELDGDPAKEIILPLQPETIQHYYALTNTNVYTHVTPSNQIMALDGDTGAVEWVFEGKYPSADDIEYMDEPILVDLTGDDLLDVIAISTDGYLYFINGQTGALLQEHLVPNLASWHFPMHLTFAGDGERGILFFATNWGNILHAWQISEQAIHDLPYNLAVSLVGGGSVVKQPDQPAYYYGDEVALSASPDPGWSFTGWSGDVVSSDNPLTLTISADAVVTATFEQAPYSLAVSLVGGGSVVKQPDQPAYYYGDEVALSASPDPGWKFTGWSGDVVSAANPVTVTVSCDTAVTANFVTYNIFLPVITR
jgi:hypothetical protein